MSTGGYWVVFMSIQLDSIQVNYLVSEKKTFTDRIRVLEFVLQTTCGSQAPFANRKTLISSWRVCKSTTILLQKAGSL